MWWGWGGGRKRESERRNVDWEWVRVYWLEWRKVDSGYVFS